MGQSFDLQLRKEGRLLMEILGGRRRLQVGSCEKDTIFDSPHSMVPLQFIFHLVVSKLPDHGFHSPARFDIRTDNTPKSFRFHSSCSIRWIFDLGDCGRLPIVDILRGQKEGHQLGEGTKRTI